MAFGVGFTGTSKGMTLAQHLSVDFLFYSAFRQFGAELHHGDCVGADEQAHKIVRWYSEPIKIHGHPPDLVAKRAKCSFDTVDEPKPYLVRNHAIVAATLCLIAAPAQPQEVLRSGTWATVRHARKLNRWIAIAFPDGSIRYEPVKA